MIKLKWVLRILGILMFAFPYVTFIYNIKNTSYLFIGLLGAVFFIASFTILRK